MIDEIGVVEAIRLKYPQIDLIYLFGSFAQNEATSDSDLDLALVGLTPDESRVLALASMELGGQFNRDVDLLDLARADAVISYEVLSKGRCLYASESFDRVSFEVRRLREFYDLEERLAPIHEDMRRSVS